MARFVSRANPVSGAALKRRSHGTTVVHHYGREDVKFTRVRGGWERTDSVNSVIVTSSAVATECNRAVGCKESWAMVY